MKQPLDCRVVVSPNGPYIVTGDPPLSEQTIVTDATGEAESWQQGAEVSVPAARYALCRCGKSGKKPFCDGTHARIGFDGTETASRKPYREQAKTFDGPLYSLLDAPALCALGQFCDARGKVWQQIGHTDQLEVRNTFLRQVEHCPAGRLTAVDKASGRALEPELPVSITLVEDPAQDCSGPIWLRGGIKVIAADGFAYETRNRVTLCRCGESKNKPFCDGTHASIKFKAK
jgi:CDGSH-type Zn-finger protein